MNVLHRPIESAARSCPLAKSDRLLVLIVSVYPLFLSQIGINRNTQAMLLHMTCMFFPFTQYLFLVTVDCVFLLLVVGLANANGGRLGCR